MAQVILIAVCFLLGSGGLLAQSPPDWKSVSAPANSAREVLLKVRESITKIQSIHYTFSNQLIRSASGEPERTTRTDGEFAYDNGLFYSSFTVSTTPPREVTGPARISHGLSARTGYDGIVYQRFENGNRRLTVSSHFPEKPYSALQPILQQFLFVDAPPRRISMEDYTNQEAWDSVIQRAKLEPVDTVNGHPCDVVSFTTLPESPQAVGNHKIFWKLYAARDLNHYPVRETISYTTEKTATRPERSVSSFVDATEVQTVGGVVIPKKIVSESKDETGRVIQSKKIELKLISVNEGLSPALFSLKRFSPQAIKYFEVTPEAKAAFESRKE